MSEFISCSFSNITRIPCMRSVGSKLRPVDSVKSQGGKQALNSSRRQSLLTLLRPEI